MRLPCSVLVLVYLSAALAAHADPVTFAFEDVTFLSGAAGSGTIVIDPATGLASALDLMVTGTTDYVFEATAPHDQGPKLGDDGYEINYFDAAGDYIQIGVVQPTLLGYDGGDLCIVDAHGDQVNCFGGSDYVPLGGHGDPAVSGTLVPLTATPEPSTWLLLCIGLLGAAGLEKAMSRERPTAP